MPSICIDPAHRCGCVADHCPGPCAACGGVALLGGGSVADSGGTYSLSPDGTGGFTASSFPTAATYTPPTDQMWDSELCLPGTVSGTSFGWGYRVSCNLDGTMRLQIRTPAISSGVCPGGTYCGYDVVGALTYTFGADAAATCSGGVLTASFAFAASTYCMGSTGIPIDPPVTSATISIPIATSGGHVCCSPCPIPGVDLTASFSGDGGSGSGTAAFDGSGGWTSGCITQGIFSLSCVEGSIKACVTWFSGGGCPGGSSVVCCSDSGGLVLADYTCSPLHLHYTVSPEGCPALADNGITDVYFDEIGAGLSAADMRRAADLLREYPPEPQIPGSIPISRRCCGG